MKRIYIILSVLLSVQIYAQQSAFLYFEDKNGLKDSLEIVVGLTDEQIGQLPSFTPDEAVQAFQDSTCWVLIQDRSPWEDRKYLHTYAYRPYNGMIEGERREIYFPADRLPITISWDKHFFIDNELPNSIMSDMAVWFDAVCNVTDMYKVLLSVEESCEVRTEFNGDLCNFDYWGDWGELLVRHFGIALGATQNPIEGMDSITIESSAVNKLSHNGQILIIRDDKMFTILGERIE